MYYATCTCIYALACTYRTVYMHSLAVRIPYTDNLSRKKTFLKWWKNDTVQINKKLKFSCRAVPFHWRAPAVSFCSRVSVSVRACALIIIYAYVRTYSARTYNNASLVTPIDHDY